MLATLGSMQGHEITDHKYQRSYQLSWQPSVPLQDLHHSYMTYSDLQLDLFTTPSTRFASGHWY